MDDTSTSVPPPPPATSPAPTAAVSTAHPDHLFFVSLRWWRGIIWGRKVCSIRRRPVILTSVVVLQLEKQCDDYRGNSACDAHGLYRVPLYDTLGAGAVEFIICHAEVTIAFVEEKKILEAGDTQYELIKKEKTDICTIMYTSGTTGDPKGVLISNESKGTARTNPPPSPYRNYDHEPEDVPMAFERTLADLQLDYLDLYLIHWPIKEKKGVGGFERFLPPDLPGTWKAMEALYDSGKVRAIGVSNFSTKKLQDILEVARVPPAANQVECHPMWQQAKLHEFCKSKGIHLSGYSPLGSQSAQAKVNELLSDPVLNTVAQKLGKSPAQVALCWGIEMGHSVLPKTSNEARLKENLDVFDWSIPEDLLSSFSEIKQDKFVKVLDFVDETSAGYKTLAELWDEDV